MSSMGYYSSLLFLRCCQQVSHLESVQQPILLVPWVESMTRSLASKTDLRMKLIIDILLAYISLIVWPYGLD